MVAGASPRRTSVSPNRADSRATDMSQQAIRPTPPPKAWPLTRAMVGQGRLLSLRSMAASCRASARFSSSLPSAIERIQLRSAPAEKLWPSPEIGRASCRERVEIGEGGGRIQKKEENVG